jgi:hypothetical protein
MSDNSGQPRLGKHGGPRTKGSRTADRALSGVRRGYILARLERDGRHDLAEAIRAGRVSALTVAAELGWTKRPEPFGTGSGNAARRRYFQLKALAGDGLDSNQMQELWLGPPSHNSSYFSSTEELEQAWETHRDEVMRLFASNGRRPQAWWAFDASGLNLKYPGYDREQSYLFEAGVLGEAERADLLRLWRREFDRRRKPAHLNWADVPHSLRYQWTAERGRRGRATHKSEPEANGTSRICRDRITHQ